jgi:hypothetical protein
LVGQTIFKISSGSYSSLNKRIQQKWTCVDVSIADREARGLKAPTYVMAGDDRREQEVTLVLQSENDSKKEYLTYGTFLSSEYITGKQYLKMEEEEEKEIRKRNQELAEERQKREEKINNRKKELTTEFGAKTAESIIAGKFVVGMSKKACEETMQSLTTQVVSLGLLNSYMSKVIRSTSTTEVWETYLQGLFGGYADGPLEYLHFNGDKLVKIDVIKNAFR